MSEWLNGFGLPPGLILILGAFLLPQLSGVARTAVVLILPVLTLVMVWLLPDGSHAVFQFMEYQLEPMKSTEAGRLFATVFALAAFVGGLYALNKATVLELSAAFFYAGSAIGVTFAGDLITLFIFWELMALGSTLVLWAAGAEQPGEKGQAVPGNPRAYSTSMRYLLLHLLGGVVLMAGIAAYVFQTGSIAFTAMQPDSLAQWLIMAGFLLNAGAPPLSAWIADAYPEASPSGMVFLSAFTTKTAVFALLVGFPGADILVYLGLYMAFYGIIYGLLENDMRRLLAYGVVTQVGFMVTAVGVGTDMALNGAAAHAVASVMYTMLLVMTAGNVMVMTRDAEAGFALGRRKLTDLGGLARAMPMTMAAGVIGALTISSLPFTAGFVTKSLEKSGTAYAAAEQGELMVWTWFLLVAASAGVVLQIARFIWFVFFNGDTQLKPAEPPKAMRYAMWVLAFLCIAIGVYPEPLYQLLPYQQDMVEHAKSYKQYTFDHVVGQLQLVLFPLAAFFVLLPLMKQTLTISVDFDWFYRKFLSFIGREFTLKTSEKRDKLEAKIKGKVDRFIDNLYEHHGPQGFLGRSWPSGSMVLWVAVLLVGSLGLYYLK